MSTKFDTRQSRNRSSLPMVGSSADEQLNNILSSVDTSIGKLFEDRNIVLTGGGTVSYSNDTLTFSEAPVLEINSRVSGGAPVLVPLSNSAREFPSDGSMFYVVVNRTTGATTTANVSTTLPQAVKANEEVFLIAKRRDTSGGVKRVYLVNGVVLEHGQSIVLGAFVSKAGDTISGSLVVQTNSSSSALRITQTGTGDALVVEDSANLDSTLFKISSDGNVGIGTSSPTVKLDISGGAAKITTTSASASEAALTVSSNGFQSNSMNNFIKFEATGKLDVARVGLFTNNLGEGGSLVFLTNSSDSGTPTEKLRIQSNGKVGIGTIGDAQFADAITVASSVTGGTNGSGVAYRGTIESDASNTTNGFFAGVSVKGAHGEINGFHTAAPSMIAGSSVSTFSGFSVADGTNSTGNYYGFHGKVNLGTSKYNLYIPGTADNYVGGKLGIGSTNPKSSLEVNGTFAIMHASDNTSGSNVTLNPSMSVVRLINPALTSISGIVGSASTNLGMRLTLVNRTGGSLTVNDNDASVTSSYRINTGTAAPITVGIDASIELFYDHASLKWSVIGGTGSGAGGSGSPLDPQMDTSFLFYTRSDFGVDKKKFVDSIVGATDSILGLKKIVFTAAGQTLTTTNLNGAQVTAENLPVLYVQAQLLYTVGKVDTPTVEFTRDGTNWFTAAVEKLSSSGDTLIASLAFTDAEPATLNLKMRVTSSSASAVTGGTELLGFGLNYVLDDTITLKGDASFEQHVVTASEASTGIITLQSVRYSPGAHQLHANINGHDFIAPDFVELGPSQVSFGANALNEGEVVRFYTSYGLVEGSSISLSKIAALSEVIVGSAAQVAAGVAQYSSVQQALNAVSSGGKIRVLKGTYSENLVLSKKCFVEGSGNDTVINGTATVSTGSSGSLLKYVKFGDNVSVDSNTSNVIITDCWVATGKTLVNSGSNNLILVLGE